MMRYCVTVLLAVALLASAAFADSKHGHGNGHGHGHGHQKCVECQYCKDDWCWKNCKRDCKNQEQGINIERCKSYGNDAGWKAAQQACDLTQEYCRPRGGRSFGAPQRPPKVSLAQCGNAAYGVCQAKAMDSRQSPCGSRFGGWELCSKDDFMAFYTGEVNWNCNQATAAFDKN